MDARLSPDEKAILQWLADQKAPLISAEERAKVRLPNDFGPDVSEWPEDFALLGDLPEALRRNEENVLRTLDAKGFILVRVWDPLDKLPRPGKLSDAMAVLGPSWSDWFSPLSQDLQGFRWGDVLSKVRMLRKTLEEVGNEQAQPDAEEELAIWCKLNDIQDAGEIERLRAVQTGLIEGLARVDEIHVRVTELGHAAVARTSLAAVNGTVRGARDTGSKRKRRETPKGVEMRGKAKKLSELIQEEEQSHSGRSQADMLREVGVSRETFRNSPHFKEARYDWERLAIAREADRGRRSQDQDAAQEGSTDNGELDDFDQRQN